MGSKFSAQVSSPVDALIFPALARFFLNPLLTRFFLLSFFCCSIIRIPPVFVIGSLSNPDITGGPDGFFYFFKAVVQNSGNSLFSFYSQDGY